MEEIMSEHEEPEEIPSDDEASEAPEVQALTPGLLRRTLANICETAQEEIAPWADESKKLPRGLDFDFRGSRTSVLGTLKKALEGLSKCASGSDDTALQQSLTHLAGPVEMLKARRSEPSLPEQERFIEAHGLELDRMSAHCAKAALALRELADLAVRGAAELDPHSVSRIVERKRDLGDATLRRIEDKIAVTRSRKDKKHLQEMRDDMRNWLSNRDARLDSVQPTVEELSLRTDALRRACLVQARRLARAAELTARAGAEGNQRELSRRMQVAREALEFSASLRAFLLASRADATAPLAPG
jgi:hypothetical protein